MSGFIESSDLRRQARDAQIAELAATHGEPKTPSGKLWRRVQVAAIDIKVALIFNTTAKW